MSPLLLADAPRWIELDPSATPDILGGILICLLTLAIFSFLYRDNPVYKLAEHLFIGVSTAWYTLQNYDGGVKGAVLDYVRDGVHKISEAAPGAAVTQDMGGYPVSMGWALFWRAMAVVLSVMLLWRLLQRNAWISRWPLALIVGIYAALKMTGETQARLVQQIKETMVAVWFPGATWLQVAGNLVLVLGLVCILAHFIFTWRRTAVLGGMSRVGVIILMLAFGSRFGFTVLGRIALLIERVSELKDYTSPGYSLTAKAGWLQTTLTPPFLLGLLIILLLALGALARRRRGGTGG
jgi:hypothetical protein